MKKKFLFSLSLLLFVVTMSFAQIPKGSVLLGGDLSAYAEKQVNNGVEYKNHQVYISPLFGKAVKDNLFFGGYFNIGLFNDNGTYSIVPRKEHSYGAGVFLRKYKVIKNNFFAFIQGNFGVSYDKQEYFQPNNNSDITQKMIATILSPGLSYKISKKLHIEVGLRDLINLSYSHQEIMGIISATLIISQVTGLIFQQA